MLILVIVIYFLILAGFIYCLTRIMFKKDLWVIVAWLSIYLSIYITFQSLIYQQTGQILLVKVFQYLKEILVLTFVGAIILYRKNPHFVGFRIRRTDRLIVLFLALGFIFFLIPLGEAGYLDRALYFKNIAMPFFLYFIGRSVLLSMNDQWRLLKVIFGISIAAFLVAYLEYIFNTHFHTVIGFGIFNDEVNLIDPQGHYGLSWTFETSAGNKRFGGFYANPLELASACLLSFPIAYICLVKSPQRGNQWVYLGLCTMIALTLFLTFSRASMLALLIQFGFIAVLFRYYKLLGIGFSIFCSLVIYIIYFASDDLRYFIIDTITFQNPSSFGHLVEWYEGMESMISNPMGIGLAMSGNANSVNESFKVGGENQFVIYGVQLGIMGLLLYVTILWSAIRDCIKAYRKLENGSKQFIPFVAAAVKFGLILPLFTANAELYLYISYVSWWFVGQAIAMGEVMDQKNPV